MAMDKDSHDGTSYLGGQSHIDESIPHEDKMLVVLDSEGADLDREKVIGAREAIVKVREIAARRLEDAIYIREVNVNFREREICEEKRVLPEFKDQKTMLQQANANLVVAALEARIWAEEIETANVQMEIAKSIAEKANLAKSLFLSNMSHELRTPLNAILGYSQLLEIGPPIATDLQAEKLQIIIKAGWYLLELIEGILDQAAIESGRLTLSLEPVPLEIIIDDCKALIEAQAKTRKIRINFLPPDKEWWVEADRLRLKQVMLNLLSNAIKYNHEGGTVEVSCSCNARRISISIKDSGIGLSSEKLAQLFQPFNRLGQEGGTEKGTGIGLVLSRELIKLMRGLITVESTEGVGSEFLVVLNQADAPQLLM